MTRNIPRFSQTQYDVLIVGGGINGAAIAHLAALNGLKVALLEKGDFASGTSSKSTKLMHGGLRYLENFEFDLVQESLKERTIQLKSIPHLVKLLPFVIPVYKNDRRPLWMMKLGVWLYDFLSGKYVIEKHKSLTRDEIIRLVPGIKQDNLLGGVMYYDAQMDDARVCLENVLMADKLGAHVANYAEAREFIKESGRTVGVMAYDMLTQQTFEVRAKKIIFTIGPWTNLLLRKEHKQQRERLRLTKGIHIVYRGEFSKYALLITTQKEKRIFFIIPWKGNALIGTTDTDYSGLPDRLQVEEEDIDYLFKEARRIFPNVNFRREGIVTTFAGLRPLAHQRGHPSQVSRKHVIEQTYSGIIYVIGGKYTTYRKIAEDALKLIMKKLPVDTEKNFTLYGSGEITEKPEDVAQRYGLAVETAQLLLNTYGARYQDVLSLINKNASLKEPICSCSPAIRAQAAYALKVEMAQNKEDVLERRLSLVYNDCPTKRCRDVISQIISKIKP